MSFLTIIRTIVLFLVLGLPLIGYIRLKKTKKSVDEALEEEQILEKYLKDENGLYPWEKNTDDCPHNIPKDAKRYPYTSGRPRRGRW